MGSPSNTSRVGIVADLVLLANVIVLTALLSMLKVALSLPGIAGIILTVGMAVDANILIYERVREERDRGRDEVRVHRVLRTDHRGDRRLGDRLVRLVEVEGTPRRDVRARLVLVVVVARPEADEALHGEVLVEDDALLGHVAVELVLDLRVRALARRLLDDRLV